VKHDCDPLVLGKLYKVRKSMQGGDRKSKSVQKSKDQNDPLMSQVENTAEKIAKEMNIAQATVKRAEKFADGIDAIREQDEQIYRLTLKQIVSTKFNVYLFSIKSIDKYFITFIIKMYHV